MSVIGGEKYARKCFSWAVSILIIVSAFGFILFFKQLGIALENEKFKIISTKFCDHKKDVTLM